MSDSIEPLELKIRVNKETGQLEIFGAELGKLGKGAKEASGASMALGDAFKHLLGPVAALATVGGVVEFLKEGMIAAEKEADSLRRLSFALQMNGVSYEQNEPKIKAWAAQMQETTRFSDDQYLGALERATHTTKDLGQAHEMVRTAMGLSVKSGKTLEESIGIISSLMAGNQREVRGLSREYAALINPTDTAGQALEKIQKNFSGLAEGEKTATAEAAQLKHGFEDMQKGIGRSVTETLTMIGPWVMQWVKGLESVGIAAAALTVALGTVLNPFAKKGAFAGAREALKAGMEDIEKLWTEHAEKVDKLAHPPLKGKKGIGDAQILKKELAEQLAVIKAAEEEQLAVKNLSEKQKIAILKASLNEQLKAITDKKGAFEGKQKEQALFEERLKRESGKKIKDIEQKNIQERVAVQEAWLAKNRQINAAIGDAARKAADSVAAEFGGTFAKLIVEGGDVNEAMREMSKRLAEQVIADLIRIGLQKAISDSIATAGIVTQTKAMVALGAATDVTLKSALALNAALI